MRIRKIRELPEKFLKRLEKGGIRELNPVQESSLKLGVLNGANLLASSPTASGKTLIAIFACAKALFDGNKVIYSVPLKALAREKYLSFKKIFPEFKIAITTGDYDSPGTYLKDKDLIVCTFEKLDSLLRHRAEWIFNSSVVVFDEIHLLNDIERGPTLEFVLTTLKEMSDPQIIGLSATIRNSEEIANWLGCKLLKSDYRPVELKEGIYFSKRVEFFDNKAEFLKDSFGFKAASNLENEDFIEIKNKYEDPVMNLVENTLESDNQVIVFVMSRKSAESLALKFAENLKIKPKEMLGRISEKAINVLETPTEQCLKLGKCLSKGIAFHHAGLLEKQRAIIEESFRKGYIKVIVATPTLAMGVSLPSFRIIIRDVKRYGRAGLEYMPVMEYKQLAGRGGRPEHHEYGEAILIAKNEHELKFLAEKYIFGAVENIYSKLAIERILRSFILSLINSEIAKDKHQVSEFFSKTFYAHQYGDIEHLMEKIENILEDLKNWGMLDNALKITALGKRVCELYIDPLTAKNFMDYIEGSKELDEFSLFLLISSAWEIKPLFSVSKSEIGRIMLKSNANNLKKLEGLFIDEYEFLKGMKFALVMKMWIEEYGEKYLFEEFRVSPGELRAKIEIASWLLYSILELCKIKDMYPGMKIWKIIPRLKHGVKEELIELVKIRGIGRVKARTLYNNNITRLEDVRKFSYEKLRKLVGEQAAKNLMKYAGREVFDRDSIMNYLK